MGYLCNKNGDVKTMHFVGGMSIYVSIYTHIYICLDVYVSVDVFAYGPKTGQTFILRSFWRLGSLGGWGGWGGNNVQCTCGHFTHILLRCIRRISCFYFVERTSYYARHVCCTSVDTLQVVLGMSAVLRWIHFMSR